MIDLALQLRPRASNRRSRRTIVAPGRARDQSGEPRIALVCYPVRIKSSELTRFLSTHKDGS
jgi:hypothetical protein